MNLQKLKDKLLSNPETRIEYEKLKPEFDKTKEAIRAKQTITWGQLNAVN